MIIASVIIVLGSRMAGTIETEMMTGTPEIGTTGAVGILIAICRDEAVQHLMTGTESAIGIEIEIEEIATEGDVTAAGPEAGVEVLGGSNTFGYTRRISSSQALSTLDTL
jgi:hypothetical protein